MNVDLRSPYGCRISLIVGGFSVGFRPLRLKCDRWRLIKFYASTCRFITCTRRETVEHSGNTVVAFGFDWIMVSPFTLHNVFHRMDFCRISRCTCNPFCVRVGVFWWWRFFPPVESRGGYSVFCVCASLRTPVVWIRLQEARGWLVHHRGSVYNVYRSTTIDG